MMKRLKYIALLSFSSLLLAACGSETENVSVETPVSSNDTETSEMTSSEKPEESASEVGKRTNPVPLGSTATQDFEFFSEDSDYNGNRSITLSNLVRGEEAYNYIMDANQFNEEAPEGMEWIIIDVEYLLNEADTEEESVYIMPEFTVVASDGSEISQTENYATLNDGEEFGYVELYSGGTASGKYAFYGPTDDEILLKFDDWNNPAIFFSLN